MPTISSSTDSPLTQIVRSQLHSKIMTTCTMFAAHTAYFSKTILSADSDLSYSTSSTPASTEAPPVFDPARLPKLEDILAKYEENFSRHLKILLDALNYYAATETVVLLGLCARLSTALDGGMGGGLNLGGEMGE